MSHKQDHLLKLLIKHVDQSPDEPFLYTKQNNSFKIAHTYQTLMDSVSSFAMALIDLGVQEADRVAIFSNNCPEWVIADLAILSLNAIVVPLYPTLSKDDCDYILNDAKTTIVIAQTKAMTQLISDIQLSRSFLKHVISIEDNAHSLVMNHLIQSFPPTLPKITVSDNVLASIVYTSGTTGFPKGVMLSHRNILANVSDIESIIQIFPTDRVLSFLPLSHVFERTVGYYCIMSFGAKIYYAHSVETVAEDIILAKPTILISVPRLYEKIYTKIKSQLHGIKKLLFYAALAIGRSIYVNKKKGLFRQLSLKLAEAVVFKKVKQKTGGCIRFFVSGGAALHADIALFFESIGFPLLEGYGLTEASPIISANTLQDRRLGSVGKVLPSQSVKLNQDKELLVRGQNIMQGYYQLENKTKDVLSPEGWLNTGDIADIDEDGFIFIVDRKKEIIVLSNGKNIPPSKIEQILSSSRYIAQSVAIGEGKNYVSALILPDFFMLRKKFSLDEKISNDDLILDTKVISFYQDIIKEKCRDLSSYERVKKSCLIAEELTQENGLLTPTLKYKRKELRAYFKKQIQSLY